MIQSFVKCFLSLLPILLLTGCGLPGIPDPFQKEEAPREVGPKWNINQTRYTCADPDFCPDNQGVILTFKRTRQTYLFYTSESWSLYRCTGTLYDADKVITAGHCAVDMEGAEQIWFKTAAKPGRPSRVFPVKGVLFKTVDNGDLWKFDYAALELATPASGIAYAHPAAKVPADFLRLTAMVSNPVDEAHPDDLLMQAVPCINRANEIHPLTLDKNPEVFMIHNCRIYGGNSGGAVVMRGDPLSIYGIVTASNRAKAPHIKVSYSDTDDDDRELDYGMVTNARCFLMPGWPLMQNDCVAMSTPILKNLERESDLNKVNLLFRRLLFAWLEDETYNFHSSPGFGLRFEPEIKTYSVETPGKGTAPRGVAVLPIPSCFKERPATAEREQSFEMPIQTRAYDFSKRFANLAPDGRRLSARVRLTPLGDSNYAVKYEISLPADFSFEAPGMGATGKLTETGDVMKIPDCGPSVDAETRRKLEILLAPAR